MEVNIIKAEDKHIADCKEALLKSELGRVYFTDEKAERALTGGIASGQVYAAENKGTCLGFIWFIPGGAFKSFTYLHIIAVKQEYRGLGIGKQLLAFLDHTVGEDEKVFLVVADFNPEAKKLYESVGYAEVGCIPGLYKQGVNEHLMMKEL